MDYSIVHLQKHDSFNVVCGNGSAHVQRTENKTRVTCELCIDPKTIAKYHPKEIVNYRNINTTFSLSKNGGIDYDGHLTVHFRWGEYYPKGDNPLAHEKLAKLVKLIQPIIKEMGIGNSVVNCNWGEWKDLTFQYIKLENTQKIFDEVIKLAKELL